MAGSMTNAFAKRVLDSIFRGGALGLDATNVWIGLMTNATDPEAGTFTEVTGGAYARQPVNRTSGASGWVVATTADPSATENSGVVTFPTASANWGTVTHFGIFDAVTAGVMIFWGDLTQSKVINSGDTATFAIGSIDITLD